MVISHSFLYVYQRAYNRAPKNPMVKLCKIRIRRRRQNTAVAGIVGEL